MSVTCPRLASTCAYPRNTKNLVWVPYLCSCACSDYDQIDHEGYHEPSSDADDGALDLALFPLLLRLEFRDNVGVLRLVVGMYSGSGVLELFRRPQP